MIALEKNKSNTVIVTLNEKSLLTGDTYNLFVFTNELNVTTKIFTCTDTSNYKTRYNQFTITESASTENLLTGQIYLTGNTSQLKYDVYESATPFSANTLSITATTGTILESGRVLIKGTDTNNTINEIYK